MEDLDIIRGHSLEDLPRLGVFEIEEYREELETMLAKREARPDNSLNRFLIDKLKRDIAYVDELLNRKYMSV